MKAEIIAVGTELLLGQIVNTNAQYLSQELAAIGVDVYFQTVVGDNETRVIQALDAAKSRAQLVILTGGLGPTQDDLTKEAAANFLDRKVEMHQPTMDYITSFFQRRGVHMTGNNSRQALVIEGSDPLTNETGLAVGIAISDGGTHYILLPGPPKEMKPMFENYAKPWIRKLLNDGMPLYSKIFKFIGIGESALEHKLIDLIKEQQDPTIAPYAKEGEIMLRLTTRALSEEEAVRKMTAAETVIRERAGEYIYAEEDRSIEEVILGMMSLKRLTLSVAESCTGGLLSDMITSVPGSSEVYRGGVICYSNALKHGLLAVPSSLLEGVGAPGAVSPEVAELLAKNMLTQAETDVAVAITGVAGPSSPEGKPVGLVYIGIARKGCPVQVEQLQLFGNRETIKLRAAKNALFHLWKQLRN